MADTTTTDDCPPDADPVVTPDAAPGTLVTTTKTKDYLNRALVNATPGTSAATDFLGRAVVTGDKDFVGRALVA